MSFEDGDKLFKSIGFNNDNDLFHEISEEVKGLRESLEEAIKNSEIHFNNLSKLESQTNSQLASTNESNLSSGEGVTQAQNKTQKRSRKMRNSPSPSTCESLSSNGDIYEAVTKEGKTGGKRSAKPLEADDSGEVLSQTSSEKKRGQNPWKNHQGAFAAKMKKCCQERNDYFKFVTFGLSEEKTEEFRAFALTYKKEYKTWNTIINFLEPNTEFRVLFVQMIIFFFTEVAAAEYGNFINNESKMEDDAKELLMQTDGQDFYLYKFDLMKQGFLGQCPDFRKKINETRKLIKADV